MCIRLIVDHHTACEAGTDAARHARTAKNLVWMPRFDPRDGVGVLLRVEIAGFRLGCASKMMSEGGCTHFTLAESL
jgi:hypothetical protein